MFKSTPETLFQCLFRNLQAQPSDVTRNERTQWAKACEGTGNKLWFPIHRQSPCLLLCDSPPLGCTKTSEGGAGQARHQSLIISRQRFDKAQATRVRGTGLGSKHTLAVQGQVVSVERLKSWTGTAEPKSGKSKAVKFAKAQPRKHFWNCACVVEMDLIVPKEKL